MAAVLVVLLLAVAFVGYRYAETVYLPKKHLADAEAAQLALFAKVRPDEADLETAAPSEAGLPDAVPSDAAGEPDTDILENAPLAAAEAVNDATVAWLTIPGTHIDYPIVQGQDNDFYLHHGFDGAYNYELGCPFLDYRCDPSMMGDNAIVYGHNIEGQRMFADIALYQEQTFLEDCPIAVLMTPNGQHTVRFFAYMRVQSTAPVYQTVFVTASDKRAYIDYIFDTASYALNLEIQEDDPLLLLSTCTFEDADARGVLVGVIEP